nr:FHA domain-containing protein [Propionibacterium sp.]
MSDLVVLGLKLLFLALLWLFVLFAVSVIRTDLFGRRVPAGQAGAVPAPPLPAAAPAPRGRAARLPTHLRVTAGPQTGLRLPLGDTFLIGRTADAALVLDDQYMSTRHALLTRTPAGYRVEDLGSTNGTFLNDTRLTEPRPMGIGDTLRIGRTTMTLDA